MNKWRLSPIAGLLLAGACQVAAAGTATIYYFTGWNPAYMHHNAGGNWSTGSGEPMQAACAGWMTKTVDLGSAADVQAVFTNGSGVWDNPGRQAGRNYVFGAGTHQLKDGQIRANAGSPCGPVGDNKAIVFYKTGWSSSYIHYAPTGGSWTNPPGVAMEAACSGWSKKEIALGSASGATLAFNNGSGTWDNNNRADYKIGVGAFKIENGSVTAGQACTTTEDKTAPTVPSGLKSSGISATSATVSWNPSSDNSGGSGLAGYDVYRDGKLIKAGVTATSYTDSGLTANTSYQYTVLAKDKAGNASAQSAALAVKTSGTGGGKLQVYYYTKTKNWSLVNLHYKTASGTWTVAPGVKMDGAACDGWVSKTVDADPSAGITAVFNNGSGVWDNNGDKNYALSGAIATVKDGAISNNAASPCVVDKTPPTAPSNLNGKASGTEVTLNWTASQDANGIAGYTITRTGGDGTVSFQSTSPSYVDSSGKPNTAYKYTVTAKDPANNVSGASNTVSVTTGSQAVVTPTFSWDNATVYFLMTDRFLNADTSNDRSYGRESNQQGQPFGNNLKDMPSAFHGGDLKGLTQKIKEGYFDKLGVNAIWFTAPYEQIHGFVSGDGSRKHYGYHGYYALDFTAIDKNMGSREDLKAMVDAAHAKGIRVVMDIVMNHSGYETLKDMWEFGFGGLNPGWEGTAFRSEDRINYDADIKPFINTGSSQWSQWWGADWLRVGGGFSGYTACQGTDGLTGCTGSLPDFRTDNSSNVDLPPLLVNKWTKEGRLAEEKAELDAWFSKTGRPRTVPHYLIKWLTDYVREFGIDGFRADTVKHVELHHWKTLKEEAQRARQDWLAANPTQAALLKGEKQFWMTGEHWGHGTERSAYFDNGFDSMINFNFQGAAGNLASIDATYAHLAGVNADNSKAYNLLNYISSHDKGLADRNNLRNSITALLMVPGGAQIFYGDESKRPLLSCCGDHAWRGDMNWDSLDTGLLTHAQKLGKFRNAHVAVGAGSHQKLSDAPYTFARVKDGDKVVIAFNATGAVQISVSGIFADGAKVRDAYSGQTATVSGGKVSLNAEGVVLLEIAQ